MKLIYSKDDDNKDGLFSEDFEHQVMMEWEKEYMEECINKLNPSGDILEIGFGMAYSADKIQSFDSVTSHTIIECNPTVLEKLEEYKKEHQNVKIVRGRWQDMLQTCDVFDGIFFDDYIAEERMDNNIRFNNFLFNVLVNHTKIGSKIVLYSNNKIAYDVDKIKCIKYENIEFSVDIPKNCRYAKGDTMCIPVITKISEDYNNLEDELILKPKNNMINVLIPRESLNSIQNIYKNIPNPKCNIIIVDNFYNNPLETRNHILTQDFSIKGNFPGQRTYSFVSEEIKNLIQKYVEPCGGKIIKFPMEKTTDNYNGCFQYTTSSDRSWIHSDKYNNWAGVLYLTPNAPVSSGTGFFRFKDGTYEEPNENEKKEFYNKYSQDLTKWDLVDSVGNKFNRIVLFRSKQYHMSLDYFGKDKYDGRLFQTFFFDTEI